MAANFCVGLKKIKLSLEKQINYIKTMNWFKKRRKLKYNEMFDIKQGTFPYQYTPPPPPPERPKQPEQDSCFWEIFQNGENIAKIRGILILDLNLTPLRIVDENQREKVLVFLPKDCVVVLSFEQ